MARRYYRLRILSRFFAVPILNNSLNFNPIQTGLFFASQDQRGASEALHLKLSNRLLYDSPIYTERCSHYVYHIGIVCLSP